jgi:hypothetical protein
MFHTSKISAILRMICNLQDRKHLLNEHTVMSKNYLQTNFIEWLNEQILKAKYTIQCVCKSILYITVFI